MALGAARSDGQPGARRDRLNRRVPVRTATPARAGQPCVPSRHSRFSSPLMCQIVLDPETKDEWDSGIIQTAQGSCKPPKTPTPPPASGPMPEPIRNYLVYFDRSSAYISPRARDMIEKVVELAGQIRYSAIEVKGYDDAGSPVKQAELISSKRAQNVADYLVNLGIPRSKIKTQGYGQANPLVPNRPNMTEPQNRRVEIILVK